MDEYLNTPTRKLKRHVSFLRERKQVNSVKKRSINKSSRQAINKTLSSDSEKAGKWVESLIERSRRLLESVREEEKSFKSKLQTDSDHLQDQVEILLEQIDDSMDERSSTGSFDIDTSLRNVDDIIDRAESRTNKEDSDGREQSDNSVVMLLSESDEEHVNEEADQSQGIINSHDEFDFAENAIDMEADGATSLFGEHEFEELATELQQADVDLNNEDEIIEINANNDDLDQAGSSQRELQSEENEMDSSEDQLGGLMEPSMNHKFMHAPIKLDKNHENNRDSTFSQNNDSDVKEDYGSNIELVSDNDYTKHDSVAPDQNESDNNDASNSTGEHEKFSPSSSAQSMKEEFDTNYNEVDNDVDHQNYNGLYDSAQTLQTAFQLPDNFFELQGIAQQVVSQLPENSKELAEEIHGMNSIDVAADGTSTIDRLENKYKHSNESISQYDHQESRELRSKRNLKEYEEDESEHLEPKSKSSTIKHSAYDGDSEKDMNFKNTSLGIDQHEESSNGIKDCKKVPLLNKHLLNNINGDVSEANDSVYFSLDEFKNTPTIESSILNPENPTDTSKIEIHFTGSAYSASSHDDNVSIAEPTSVYVSLFEEDPFTSTIVNDNTEQILQSTLAQLQANKNCKDMMSSPMRNVESIRDETSFVSAASRNLADSPKQGVTLERSDTAANEASFEPQQEHLKVKPSKIDHDQKMENDIVENSLTSDDKTMNESVRPLFKPDLLDTHESIESNSNHQHKTEISEPLKIVVNGHEHNAVEEEFIVRQNQNETEGSSENDFNYKTSEIDPEIEEVTTIHRSEHVEEFSIKSNEIILEEISTSREGSPVPFRSRSPDMPVIEEVLETETVMKTVEYNVDIESVAEMSPTPLDTGKTVLNEIEDRTAISTERQKLKKEKSPFIGSDLELAESDSKENFAEKSQNSASDFTNDLEEDKAHSSDDVTNYNSEDFVIEKTIDFMPHTIKLVDVKKAAKPEKVNFLFKVINTPLSVLSGATGTLKTVLKTVPDFVKTVDNLQESTSDEAELDTQVTQKADTITSDDEDIQHNLGNSLALSDRAKDENLSEEDDTKNILQDMEILQQSAKLIENFGSKSQIHESDKLISDSEEAENQKNFKDRSSDLNKQIDKNIEGDSVPKNIAEKQNSLNVTAKKNSLRAMGIKLPGRSEEFELVSSYNFDTPALERAGLSHEMLLKHSHLANDTNTSSNDQSNDEITGSHVNDGSKAAAKKNGFRYEIIGVENISHNDDHDMSPNDHKVAEEANSKVNDVNSETELQCDQEELPVMPSTTGIIGNELNLEQPQLSSNQAETNDLKLISETPIDTKMDLDPYLKDYEELQQSVESKKSDISGATSENDDNQQKLAEPIAFVENSPENFHNENNSEEPTNDHNGILEKIKAPDQLSEEQSKVLVGDDEKLFDVEDERIIDMEESKPIHDEEYEFDHSQVLSSTGKTERLHSSSATPELTTETLEKEATSDLSNENIKFGETADKVVKEKTDVKIPSTSEANSANKPRRSDRVKKRKSNNSPSPLTPKKRKKSWKKDKTLARDNYKRPSSGTPTKKPSNKLGRNKKAAFLQGSSHKSSDSNASKKLKKQKSMGKPKKNSKD